MSHYIAEKLSTDASVLRANHRDPLSHKMAEVLDMAAKEIETLQARLDSAHKLLRLVNPGRTKGCLCHRCVMDEIAEREGVED